MSAVQLKLTELTLEHCPGFTHPLSISIEAQEIALVVGPNESGKSSLARGLSYLLWPDLCLDPALEVTARFAAGGRNLFAQLRGKRTHWFEGGVEVAAPSLPAKELAACFRLSVDERETEAASGDVLAARIRRALAGGYDLGAACAMLRPKQREGALQREALRAAKTALTGISDLQRELAKSESGLESLKAEFNRVSALEAQAAPLKAALQLRKERAALVQIDAELAPLSGSERVGLNDFKRWQEELGQLEHQRTKALALSTLRARASEKLRGFWLFERAVDPRAPAARFADAKALEGLERECTKARMDWRAAQERAERWTKLSGDELGRLPSDEELLEFSSLCSELARHKAIVESSETLHALIPQPGPAQGTSQLGSPRRATTALGVLSILCIVIGAFEATHLTPGLWSLVVVGVIGALIAIGAWRDATKPAVNPLALARGLLETQRQASESALQGLQARAAAVQQRHGLEPGLKLSALTEYLRQKIASADGVDAAAAALTVLEQQFDHQRDAIANFIQVFDREPAASAEGLSGQLQDLAQSFQQLETLRESEQRAEHEAAAAQAEVEATRQRIEKIFVDAGIENKDSTRLEQLARGRKLFDELTQQKALHTNACKEAELILALHPEIDLAGTDQVLQERYDGLPQQRAEATRLRNQIRDIEKDVLERRAKDDFEAAKALVETARDALERERERVLDTATALLLLEDVEQALQTDAHDAKLAQAQVLFERFTHGRHSLQLAGEHRDGQSFSAFDHEQGRSVEFDVLSSGTRTQLLLAARLAFAIDAAEHSGVRVPLLMDETLATTDETRFAAIAEALTGMVEDGWQVIYFTSQRSDVERWRQRASANPRSEPQVIELTRAQRSSAAASEASEFMVPALEPVPAPAGRSAEDYALELAVPALDLELPFGEQHVFHVVRDDLELVRELVVLQAGKLGVAERLSKAHDFAFGSLRREQRELIAARIGLLRAFHELWLVGRGRLVDPSVLRAAVSETFATEVIEVAKECGRDARALIEALRAGKVKRFGGKKIDDLELALCEGGFIDRRPPITFEDLVWKARGHSELPSDSIREWCARWWAASQRAFETRRGKSLRADSTIGAVEGSKDG